MADGVDRSSALQDEIFSSAFATAAYLKQILQFPADKKVYIVGMSGIRDELNAENIRTCGVDVCIGQMRNAVLRY